MTKKKLSSLQQHIERCANDAKALSYSTIAETHSKNIFNYEWHKVNFYPFELCYIGQPEEVGGLDGDYVRLEIASLIGILAN